MAFKVLDLQNWTKAQVVNEEFTHALLPVLAVTGMSSLAEASENDVVFFFSKHYQDQLLRTKAKVIITGLDFVEPLRKSGIPSWKTSVYLACANPYAAMATVSAQFSALVSTHDHQAFPLKTDIHPTAVIDPSVKIGNQVLIKAGVVIEAGSVIQDGAVIYPHCFVGPNCTIGEGTVLFPGVTLYEKTILGKRCRIHAGAVIGADGFGYSQILKEGLPVGHQKIYHLGNVVVGDEVEVGANSCIDRGTLGSTVIHRQVKIDNQVQVGHNCEIGEGSILCGCAGMAGSSTLGKFVMVGAQSGTGNQVHVGDYAKLGAYTGVSKDLEAGAEVMGIPARKLGEFFKVLAVQNKLIRGKRKASHE